MVLFGVQKTESEYSKATSFPRNKMRNKVSESKLSVMVLAMRHIYGLVYNGATEIFNAKDRYEFLVT